MPSFFHLARVALGIVALSVPLGAQAPDVPDVGTVLDRAGERVQQALARAQTIVATETVRIQPLGMGLDPDGFARTVISELRTTWAAANADGPSEAQVERQVLTVNGRPPKPSPDSCTVPEQRTTQSQPLSMLLPKQREEYAFAFAGFGRSSGRRTVMVDFRERALVHVDAHVENDNKDCIGFDVSGGMRGRIWIDAETYDVLRIDQRLGGLVDVKLPREALRYGGAAFWTLERLDQSLEFKPVVFTEPEEVLILPVQATELSVLRADGTRRTRTTTIYSKYLRMLTGGRLVNAQEAEAPQ